MMFVPPPINERSSPASLELAQRLNSVIQEFRSTHPGMTSRELRNAIRMAQMSSGVGGMKGTVLALVIGLLILGLGAGLFFSGR